MADQHRAVAAGGAQGGTDRLKDPFQRLLFLHGAPEGVGRIDAGHLEGALFDVGALEGHYLGGV